jgi:hypothetical protein
MRPERRQRRRVHGLGLCELRWAGGPGSGGERGIFSAAGAAPCSKEGGGNGAAPSAMALGLLGAAFAGHVASLTPPTPPPPSPAPPPHATAPPAPRSPRSSLSMSSRRGRATAAAAAAADRVALANNPSSSPRRAAGPLRWLAATTHRLQAPLPPRHLPSQRTPGPAAARPGTLHAAYRPPAPHVAPEAAQGTRGRAPEPTQQPGPAADESGAAHPWHKGPPQRPRGEALAIRLLPRARLRCSGAPLHPPTPRTTAHGPRLACFRPPTCFLAPAHGVWRAAAPRHPPTRAHTTGPARRWGRARSLLAPSPARALEQAGAAAPRVRRRPPPAHCSRRRRVHAAPRGGRPSKPSDTAERPPDGHRIPQAPQALR